MRQLIAARIVMLHIQQANLTDLNAAVEYDGVARVGGDVGGVAHRRGRVGGEGGGRGKEGGQRRRRRQHCKLRWYGLISLQF